MPLAVLHLFPLCVCMCMCVHMSAYESIHILRSSMYFEDFDSDFLSLIICSICLASTRFWIVKKKNPFL